MFEFNSECFVNFLGKLLMFDAGIGAKFGINSMQCARKIGKPLPGGASCKCATWTGFG